MPGSFLFCVSLSSLSAQKLSLSKLSLLEALKATTIIAHANRGIPGRLLSANHTTHTHSSSHHTHALLRRRTTSATHWLHYSMSLLQLLARPSWSLSLSA